MMARFVQKGPEMNPDERLIEEALLGAPLRYTRKEVEARAEISEEFARRIWQALGFPRPAEDEIAFTDRDLAALRDISELLRHDIVDEDLVLHLARAVGQSMGRLASWLGGVVLERVSAQPDRLLTVSEELRPRFEQLLLHGWRRQLAAVGLQTLSTTGAADATGGGPSVGVARLAVGFADIVSFTRLSRRMNGEELAAFVEHFETTAADLIAELGGRLIKTLGDEVLFAADEPAHAAELALRIVEYGTVDADFPQVRAGLAYGEVIARFGDVFGTPVNLAARLTATAYPGTVLADPELAEALDERYHAVALRPRPLQGLGRVRPYAVRRA
jgi:adenylate cyclase